MLQLCCIMHPQCCRPVAWKPPLPGYRLASSWVYNTTSCNTQSSAPEDGRDHRPKHVELIGIINKPLLLHLFGVYIIYNISSVYFITTKDLHSWFDHREFSVNMSSLDMRFCKPRLWRINCSGSGRLI